MTDQDMARMIRFTSAQPGDLHVMMGVPGSGKSTVADKLVQEHNAIRVSPDEIRRMLTGDPSNQERNAEVFDHAHRMTKSNLAQGNHVVFDATNVQAKARRGLLDIANGVGAKKHLHVVDPGLDTAKFRNQNRERVVPDEVLDRMHGEMSDSARNLPFEGWDTINTH